MHPAIQIQHLEVLGGLKNEGKDPAHRSTNPYYLYSPSDAFSVVSGIHNFRFENGRRYISYLYPYENPSYDCPT